MQLLNVPADTWENLTQTEDMNRAHVVTDIIMVATT
jgi:hypothetical protein